MAIIAAFLMGVVLTGLALPAFQWVRGRIHRYRSAATLTKNQVTTVSQVLHLTVQGSPTGVVVVDSAGAVLLSNGSAHDMGAVHGRSLHKDIWQQVTEVFRTKETQVLEFSTNTRRAGRRITSVRAVVQPLTLVDDRFVVVFCTDESENQRMESARRDFVANVSHELKTPVGGMALLAEAITEASDDPEQVEYFGKKINAEAHRLADMINELISLSKLQGAEALPDMEPVAIDDVIKQAVARNLIAAENAGIELRTTKLSNVYVLGDRSLLITAVSNLISNAINYSPNAMPVVVSTKVVSGETVLIRVVDRGIGIAQEDQSRVFERFFRVDKARSRSTGGTGLGLAIVKHVAANHGGEIKLWSRLGSGSTFTIELPIYNEQQKPALEHSAPALEPNLTLPTNTGLGAGTNRGLQRRKEKS